MSRLSLKNLCLSYGDRRVLHNLTLDFPSQSLIGIVGPNGCGKSTLISLLANLQRPTSGKVMLDDRELRQYSRRTLATRIAYLAQNPICPPGITVAQVLGYGRQPYQTLLRQFNREDAEKIAEVRDMLQLGSIMERPMDQLSGGQRQKAWLGMVLAQDTDIILLDEPTSALDIGHQHEVLECIRSVCNLGKTVIMVIHDLAAAGRFCDHLIAIKDGIIQQSGAPADVITKDVILSLYGIHVEIFSEGPQNSPVIVPLRLQEEELLT